MKWAKQKLNNVWQGTEWEGACCYWGSEKQLVRVCLWSAEGERDNIFGGLEAGNKNQHQIKKKMQRVGQTLGREGGRGDLGKGSRVKGKGLMKEWRIGRRRVRLGLLCCSGKRWNRRQQDRGGVGESTEVRWSGQDNWFLFPAVVLSISHPLPDVCCLCDLTGCRVL